MTISLAEFGLGMEVDKREHTCLAIRTYATFREDHDALLPEGYQELFIEDNSDGEPEDNLCKERECTFIDEDSAMVSYFVFDHSAFQAYQNSQHEEDEHSVYQALIPASLPAACPLFMASVGTSGTANTSSALSNSNTPTSVRATSHLL